ncbi:MAG TPA: ribonuclease III [Pseudomonadales bacterium]|nr:ribonuclease III [Pseudomonadales bacterium]
MGRGRQTSTPADSAVLEERLGHVFADGSLLELALTHRSRSGSRNNERLEFLGDAFLGFVVAAELFDRHPGSQENELTLIRASLVRRRTLAELARELSLGDFLLLGQGELRSGGFRRDSILADAVEALIGAVLLDGGEAPARALVLSMLGTRLDDARPGVVAKDPKTRLQEFLQGKGEALPEYRIAEVHGSDHDQVFVVECRVATRDLSVAGRGASRRAAEQQAAQDTLEMLEADQHGEQHRHREADA